MQEKHPHEYARLIWADKLSALLESVQKECEEWVRRMEMIRERAEEVVREEIMG